MFNWLKTGVLMAAITALFGLIGAWIGGQTGMLLALGFALISNFFAYWFSDKMVLRMYNAQEVDESSAPQFYAMVRELAQRAGLPMPRVYLINEDAPNAFATGRNPEHAAVAATTGLLRILSASELRGVMAISRAREFEADRLGAEISGEPRALAGALEKIHHYAQGIPLPAAQAHPETAQMMIMNPLHGGGLQNLFSTHPSTDERIRRLLAMAPVRQAA